MSRYTPPEQPMDLVEHMMAGCGLLLIGLTVFGIVVLVLTLLGLVR